TCVSLCARACRPLSTINRHHQLMNRARKQITVRPQQPFSWLGLAAILLTGATVAGNIYGRGVWLFAAVLVMMVIGFACDALVFDGQRLRRRGPGALLGALAFGRRREL